MFLGMIFLGLLCQIAGAFIVQDQIRYAASLWFGILMAAVSVLHMYRSLDRGLDYNQETAAKIIFRGYIIRYVSVAVILLIIVTTDVLNVLVVFMAYMSLKVTAFIQPITHKLCNKLFRETDPVALPLPEDEQEQISNER